MSKKEEILQIPVAPQYDEGFEGNKYHEVLGFSLCLIASFLLLALLSYSGVAGNNGKDLMGTVGKVLVSRGLNMVGLGVYVLDVAIWITAVALVAGR